MDNQIFTAPGELVSADGNNYHVRRFGEAGPLIIMECGLTMMSACWGWLAPQLANFARVITYDRAGLGWSDARDGRRDCTQMASELSALLDALRINEPVVLLGHSMGATINRALVSLKPDSVRSVVWLDPAHPEQMKRRGIRLRMRNLLVYIEAAQLLAAKNIPAIEVPLIRHCQGLPEEDYKTLRRFLRNPRHLRATASEARAWEASADIVRGKRLGPIPLLIISGQRGALPDWDVLQQDLAGLSDNPRHLSFPEMSHISMLANRRQALKVTEEIHHFLEH